MIETKVLTQQVSEALPGPGIAPTSYAVVHAACAQRGVHLAQSIDEEKQPVYVVHRWGMSREHRTLDGVLAWLDWAHPLRGERR